MCSFLVTNLTNIDIQLVNKYLKYRGPDNTNIKIICQILFLHNLLHMTGEKKIQPFMKDEIVCVYNGEIYNYLEFGNYQTDGECLIPLYQKYGETFTQYLDGEFAIVLFDFSNNKFIISTDIFRTKPIWYAIENNNFGIASYQSALINAGFHKSTILTPNTILVFNISNLKIIHKYKVHTFSTKQYKTNYDDWVSAFKNALLKRCQHTHRKFFVSLSSGYDSGAICCILNQLGIEYKTYSVFGKENKNVIKKRNQINKMKFENYTLDKKKVNKFKKRNHEVCEDFIGYPMENKSKIYQVLNDNASNGHSYIFNKAKLNGYIINLSGQGADEIIADYGHNGNKFANHSIFGGKFPENLDSIFPWYSVFSGMMECLIMKEEIIGGSYGIETRYPFLDKQVVQEFLWLSPQLKNKEYKAPVHYLLQKFKYPFDKNKKIGFNHLT